MRLYSRSAGYEAGLNDSREDLRDRVEPRRAGVPWWRRRRCCPGGREPARTALIHVAQKTGIRDVLNSQHHPAEGVGVIVGTSQGVADRLRSHPSPCRILRIRLPGGEVQLEVVVTVEDGLDTLDQAEIAYSNLELHIGERATRRSVPPARRVVAHLGCEATEVVVHVSGDAVVPEVRATPPRRARSPSSASRRRPASIEASDLLFATAVNPRRRMAKSGSTVAVASPRTDRMTSSMSSSPGVPDMA